MAPIEHDALQLGMDLAWPRPNSKMSKLTTTLLAGGGLALLMACLMTSAAHGFSPAAVVSLFATSLSDDFELSSACFSSTGASCHLYNCPTEMNATCSHHQCMCGGPDSCAGSDNKCHAGRNEVLWSDFKLRNKQYPEERMYVPDFFLYQQLRSTGDDLTGLAAGFALSKMPAEKDSHQKFILTSINYENYAIKVGKLYHVEATKIDSALSVDPARISLTVCVPDEDDSVVMIGGVKKIGGSRPFRKSNIAWLSLTGWSSRVFGEKGLGDTDTNIASPSGQWHAEPPFPASILAQFPKCSSIN